MSVPTLAELQRAVRAALLGDDVAAAAAAVIADGLAPAARLAIYRHHVTASLTAALRDTYPVVCRLVDERFFGYAADAYIRREPPGDPRLFAYGAGFAAFLAGFPPCQGHPYLPDVARLEWALNAAYHAEDVPTPDGPQLAARLATVSLDDTPRLAVALHPSVRYLTSPYPLDLIWRANQAGAAEEAVNLDAGAVHLEVRRAADDAVFRRLPPAEWTLRRALADGRALEEAGAAALRLDPALDLSAALAALLSERLITDVITPSREEAPPC